VLRTLKNTALLAASASGISGTLRDSAWRSSRLLILGYHGVALNDEHEWEPGLYVKQDVLRRRFDSLRDGKFVVLPLDEAICRLQNGTLPSKAVSITFDDGTRDFALAALPLLEEYGYPATLYLTTFYCLHQVPVFDTMCRYLLWMGRDQVFDTSLVGSEPSRVSLKSASARMQLFLALRRAACDRDYSWSAKDELLAQIAGQLGFDYNALCARRLMFLMSPEQVSNLPEDLVDVQLHTHRHRSPLNRDKFLEELDQNRRVIRNLRPRTQARHFCYPSGITHPLLLEWLHDAEVVSAATCDLGLASSKDDPLMLPRLIDSQHVSDLLFASWLDGIGAFLPHRTVMATDF
jgi:peptidoglycan/xylan/chitin deacetylase (PgdA/CDA1 family)